MSKLKSRILGLLYCTPMSLINMENNNSLSIKFNILSLATIIHILISSLGVNQLAETQYFSPVFRIRSGSDRIRIPGF